MAIRKARFEGRPNGLRGHTFQTDRLAITMREITDYAGSNYKRYGNIWHIVEKCVSPKISMSPAPGSKASESEKIMWGKKIDVVVKHEELHRDNLEKMLYLILGKCSDIMKEKLLGLYSFKAVKGKYDA